MSRKELFNRYKKAKESGELPKNISFMDYLIAIINTKDATIKLMSKDLGELFGETD